MADTSGLTHGRVLRMAVPVVLSNATVPILGAVDTAVVGQLGQAAPIAAVGAGAVILASVYWVFGFLRMGTTGMVAQALGAGDGAEATALLARALLVGAGAGVLLIAAQGLLFAGALRLAPLDADVAEMARAYLGIRVWSAPAAIALYGITGWLIASERTGAVLVLQVAMNGINIGLDFWFVLGLGWGVPGVAAATFLAEWGGLILGLWLVRRAFTGGAWRGRIWDAVRLRAMVAVNRDILIRSLLLQASFTTFLLAGGAFGTVALAANQVLLQFVYITSYALDGFAFAVEALVGRAFGAGDRVRLRRAAILCGGWGVATALVVALGFAISGQGLVALMAASDAVRAEAARYLPWVIAMPVISVWAFMLDGVFIGATRTRDMAAMMAVSFAAYLVALAVLVPWWGAAGLWSALAVMFTVRGATLAWRYPALERAAGG